MSTSHAFPLTPTQTSRHAAVLAALAWRFLRRSTQSVLPLLGILWGLPTVLYLLLGVVDADVLQAIAAGDVSLKRLYFLLTMTTIPLLPLTELLRIRPLYSLPVTTRQIVHDQLGIGIVTVVVVHLLTVAYYRLAFGATIPALGPLLFLIPGLLMSAGLLAFLVNARLWKIPVALVLVGFFGSHGGFRFDNPAIAQSRRGWLTPTLNEMVVLLAAAVAGYLVARHVADRDRCGETRGWTDLDVVELWHHLTSWLVARRSCQPAGSQASLMPSAATVHSSYEWQTRGIVVPIIATFGGLLSLIGAWFNPAEWLLGYMVAIPGPLFFGMALSGVFAGMLFEGKSAGTMDGFRATRPLTDGQLATIALRNALCSTAVAMLILLGYALLVTAYAYLCGESPIRVWSEYQRDSQPIFRTDFPDYITIVLIAAMHGWALLGFCLSCVATGRQWLYVGFWMIAVGGMFVPTLLTNLLTNDQLQIVAWCAAILFAITAALGTIICYRAAVMRGLIPASRGLIGGAMWLSTLR